MSKIIKLLLYATKATITLALFTRTIFWIKFYIEKCIKYFRNDEEGYEDDEESDKNVEECVQEFCMFTKLNEEPVRMIFHWIVQHKFLYIIIGYIFCFIPILNVFLTLIYLGDILEEES